MKRTMLILTVLLCALLTGCCLSHEWQEATCEVPKTCAKCGETEGEALGHSWQDAACTEAKICSVCAATEGEPLGHKDLTEANYQQAAVCGVCGEEVGEPLTPGYEKLKVPGKFFEVGETVDYVTNCYEDPSRTTTGKLSVVNYETFESDETHPAKEGYEWKIVDFEIVFSDAEANKYGCSIRGGSWDFYDINEEESYEDTTENSEFEVNWYGTDYTECWGEFSLDSTGWIDGTLTYYLHYETCIPVGYDGQVVSSWRSDDPLFIDRTTRYTPHFRLD